MIGETIAFVLRNLPALLSLLQSCWRSSHTVPANR